MALHLVTAQKSLNFRQLSSFWMVVQGKTITRTCFLAWLWGGTQLHSSGSREEHKAEALPCSAKEMNHWTALLELLALNCLYRDITVRVCACVHTYMATLFSTSLSFLITTLWTGKSSYSPNCSITVGITSLYFDWGPIWFSGLGSIIWESTSRKKKKSHFETMATVCLENCKIDLILPSQDLRLLTNSTPPSELRSLTLLLWSSWRRWNIHHMSNWAVAILGWAGWELQLLATSRWDPRVT